MKLQPLLTHIAVHYVTANAHPTKQTPVISNEQLKELVSDHNSFVGVFDELQSIVSSTQEAQSFQFYLEGDNTKGSLFEDPYTVRIIKVGYMDAAHYIIRSMFSVPVQIAEQVSADFGNCKDNSARERFEDYANDVKGLLRIFDEKFAITADEIRIVDLEQNDEAYRECIELADKYRHTFTQLSFYLQAEGRTHRKEVK